MPEADAFDPGQGFSGLETFLIILAIGELEKGKGKTLADDKFIEHLLIVCPNISQGPAITVFGFPIVSQPDFMAEKMVISKLLGHLGQELNLFPRIIELGRIDPDEADPDFPAVREFHFDRIAVIDGGDPSGIKRRVLARGQESL